MTIYLGIKGPFFNALQILVDVERKIIKDEIRAALIFIFDGLI